MGGWTDVKIAGVCRTLTGFLLASSIAMAASDRDLAEWVIRWEGRVILEGNRRPINDSPNLPPGDFRIVGIDLTGAVMLPAELGKARRPDSPCASFTCPARSGTREAATRTPTRSSRRWPPYRAREAILRLALQRADQHSRTADFAHLAALTEMKDFRCSQCRITNLSLASWTKLAAWI